MKTTTTNIATTVPPTIWPMRPELAAIGDPRELLRYLHSEVKLSDRELERVTGVHRVTISRWRSAKAKSEPRDVGRLDDLRVIVGLMVNSRAFSAEEAGRFLRSRDPDLDHQAPLALLANTDDDERNEQEFRRVLEITRRLVDRITPGTSGLVSTSEDGVAQSNGNGASSPSPSGRHGGRS